MAFNSGTLGGGAGGAQFLIIVGGGTTKGQNVTESSNGNNCGDATGFGSNTNSERCCVGLCYLCKTIGRIDIRSEFELQDSLIDMSAFDTDSRNLL